MQMEVDQSRAREGHWKRADGRVAHHHELGRGGWQCHLDQAHLHQCTNHLMVSARKQQMATPRPTCAVVGGIAWR